MATIDKTVRLCSRELSFTYTSVGLVELFLYERWGTVTVGDISGSHFDKIAADTVCRQLGYTSANMYGAQWYVCTYVSRWYFHSMEPYRCGHHWASKKCLLILIQRFCTKLYYSLGPLIREVSLFQRCPLREVPLPNTPLSPHPSLSHFF